jgi:5-(carboxyamino)imidazole ribonucleotide mutase
MPSGVPVATVAIGNAGAKNAAVLSLTILGAFDDKYHEKLVEYKKQMKEKVLLNTNLDLNNVK